MKNISNKAIGIVIGALVVGLIVGWFVGHAGASKVVMVNDQTQNGSNAEMASSTDMTADSVNSDSVTSISMMAEGDGAILVSDQKAGNTVTVASVEAGDAVWVVVREDKIGPNGNILGAARVDSGASNNIVVDLLRPTMADQMYHIVLFKDNGDKVFDFKVDTLLQSDGALISQSFKVQ